MGSVMDAASRAGAYNPKHYALDNSNIINNPNGPLAPEEVDNYQTID